MCENVNTLVGKTCQALKEML